MVISQKGVLLVVVIVVSQGEAETVSIVGIIIVVVLSDR